MKIDNIQMERVCTQIIGIICDEFDSVEERASALKILVEAFEKVHGIVIPLKELV